MTLPTSIRKRNGRLDPFEPDKLARSVFAATEALGVPNAFLARELTDSVLHFLAGDVGQLDTTEQLSELTTKVIRELGHPVLAKVYQDFTATPAKEPAAIRLASQPVDDPAKISRDDVYALVRRAAASEISNFSLKHVYPRDLASAHREGLFELLDLETPFEMTGAVLQCPIPLDAWQMFETLRGMRIIAGAFVSFDGLEQTLAATDGEPEAVVREFAQTLEKTVSVTGPRCVLNLNLAEPAWASKRFDGPLFSGWPSEVASERLDRVSLLCLNHAKGVRVFWHLSERDFANRGAERLHTAVETALAHGNVDFVFDRPRKPIVLGPGLNRDRPAVLGQIAMNLVRFVEHLGGGPIDRELYLRKLASLARFAKSAGRARQDFLRERGVARLREGFLLDRAAEVIVPMGVCAAARLVAGEAVSPDEVADLACESLRTIRTALETDQPRIMTTAIDFPLDSDFGFVIDDLDLPVRKQLRLIAQLQAAADGGFVAVSLKRNAVSIVQEVSDLLRAAWRGGVQRLRIACEG